MTTVSIVTLAAWSETLLLWLLALLMMGRLFLLAELSQVAADNRPLWIVIEVFFGGIIDMMIYFVMGLVVDFRGNLLIWLASITVSVIMTVESIAFKHKT